MHITKKEDRPTQAWRRLNHGVCLATLTWLLPAGMLQAERTVTAWGRNTEGQLNLPGALSNTVAMAVGWNYSLALQADGTVIAWGHNENNQTNVPAGLANVVAVAACERTSLALRWDGTVVLWGDTNITGLPVGLSNVVMVAGGRAHSMPPCPPDQHHGRIELQQHGSRSAAKTFPGSPDRSISKCPIELPMHPFTSQPGLVWPLSSF